MVRGSFHQRVVDQLRRTGLEHWSSQRPPLEGPFLRLSTCWIYSDSGESDCLIQRARGLRFLMVSFDVVFPRTSGYMSDRSSSPTSLDHIEASIFQREQGMRVAPVCLSRACQLINDMRKHPTKPQPLRRSTFLDMQKIHCHCLSSRHHDSGDICVLHSPPYPGKKKSNRSCCQNMLNPLCWSLLTLYSTHHISLLHLQSTSIFKVYPFPRSVLRFEIIRRHWAGAQEAPQPSQPILEGRSEEGGGQALVGAGGEHREPLQLLQGLGGWFDGYIILCMDTYHNLDT